MQPLSEMKTDERVLFQSAFPERRGDAAHHVVDGRHHRRVDPGPLFLDVRVAVYVLARGLNRRVGRVRRQHQEERFVRVALDERDGAVGKHVGQVLIDFHDLVAVQDRARTVTAVAGDRRRPYRVRLRRGGLPPGPAMGVGVVGVDVARAAPQVAEELVEAALQRVVLLAEAQVPLPHQAGRVTGRAHHVAERRLVLGQP